jgi:3',5'-cyclic AMP phosphodiesterase CpdA
MRKLAHLSDLHFGRVDMTVVDALRNCLEAIAPEVIAVSGDLTQRATAHQFAAARRFLDSLPAPAVVVPGNHDIPLHNVFARFLTPLARYRRFVASEAEAAFVDDEIVVVGVNTARSNVFKGGRINVEQVLRARRIFHEVGRERLRVLVTHHPFQLASMQRRDRVGRADMALAQLRECMPDILLAGHMHAHEIGTTARRNESGRPSALVVQAGTATSTRGRGERNSFNLLYLERHAVRVCRYDWKPEEAAFTPAAPRRYVRRGIEWVSDDEATIDAQIRD